MKRGTVILRMTAIALCVAAVVYYIRFHQPGYERWALLRENRAGVTSERIQVAIVWPQIKGLADPLIRGAELAVDEINRTGGITLSGGNGIGYSRELELRLFDESSVGAGVEVARKIATDVNILAVIGHATDSAIPASVIYNLSGDLFIAPTQMNPALTMHGFPNVFSIAPLEEQVANAMVQSVRQLAKQKRIRLAILYPEKLFKHPSEVIIEEVARRARKFIEPLEIQVDIEVVFATAYQRSQLDYSQAIEPLLMDKDLFEVILILDVLPDAGLLRRQLEESLDAVEGAPEKLILGLDALDWSSSQDSYAQFTPERSKDFYVKATELVLSEVKQRVALITSRDGHGTRLGSEIQSSIRATADNSVVPVSLELYRSYAADSQSHMSLAWEVLEKKIDIVFLAGTGDNAMNLIKQLREAGVESPIICSPGLESDVLVASDDPLLNAESRASIDKWIRESTAEDKSVNVSEVFSRLRDTLGFRGTEVVVQRYIAERSGRTLVVSAFNSTSQSAEVEEFLKTYKNRYGVQSVGSLAAAGYQSIQLLKGAFQRAGSTSTETASGALLLFVTKDGIFGKNRFSLNGNLLGLEIVLKELAPDGTVRTVEIK